MNLNQGKRNKQAVQVLNRVEYDSEGNPIGMMEDPSNPASANFGTPREPRRGGCYLGNGSAYITITGLLSTDTVEVLDGSDLPIISNGRLDIASGDKVFGVKIFRAGELWGKYNCSENSGSIAYDSSGNSNHGTIVNAITTTPEENPNSIHQYQDVYSFENEEGYSESGSVLIPKNSSITLPPFKDVLGNNLQYVGKVPGKAKFVNSSCFKGGSSAYLAITGLLTTDTIEVFGSSGIPTIPTNGELHVAAGDNVYGVKILRDGVLWSYLPLCEPIIDPSNHIYHDVSGNGNHATLINGTLANDGKQDKFHYLQRGFEKISYLKGGGGSFGFVIPRQLYGYSIRVKPLSNTQTAGIIGGTGGFRVDTHGSGITMKSGRFRAQAKSGNIGYLSAVYPYTIGVWYHLVVTFSEIAPVMTGSGEHVLGNARFYVNGELFDEQLNVQLTEYPYQVNVLTQYVNTPLNDSAECLVSDAALPNVELSPSEVKALYNREYSNLDLICLYEFKEVENSLAVYDSVCKIYTSLHDSPNGYRNFELVPKKQDRSEGATGVAINCTQDSHSFLNTGTELESYDYPALRQADKDDDFWNEDDGLGTITPKPVQFDSLITQKGLSNKLFLDSSVSETIKNVRMYGNDLKGRQLNTENKLTNN